MSADAVGPWHDLLDRDTGLAAASAAQLDSALRRDDLVFGTRPLCTVLRPRFFTIDEYSRLCRNLAVLMGAFRTAYDRAVADPAARAQFGLLDWEEHLFTADRGNAPAAPMTRVDAFGSPGGAVAVTEFNGETPAGASYNDALGDAFADLPVTRTFARDWWVRPLEARRGVLRSLLGAYEAWRGTRETPRVAILDWSDVPTRSEFELFRRYLESRGIPCTIGDPRECEYDGTSLRLRGEPVTLIYKRVLIDELVERAGMGSAVVRATLDGAVCLLNGFRCKVLHKKASLAVLSDERNAGWFDTATLAAIRAQIPWTRVVAERRTRAPDGSEVDLLSWIAGRRSELVLKPNDAYGGAGIVLGWTVDDGEWSAAIRRALAEPYIVQARVSVPREAYPSLEAGRVEFIERQVDTAPFVCDYRYVEGVLSRLSTAELLNVTAGGGSQTPTFLVERR